MIGDQHIRGRKVPIQHAARAIGIAALRHELQHVFQPRQRIGAQHFRTLRFQSVDRCINMGGQDRRFCYHARNEHCSFP